MKEGRNSRVGRARSFDRPCVSAHRYGGQTSAQWEPSQGGKGMCSRKISGSVGVSRSWTGLQRFMAVVATVVTWICALITYGY